MSGEQQVATTITFDATLNAIIIQPNAISILQTVTIDLSARIQANYVATKHQKALEQLNDAHIDDLLKDHLLNIVNTQTSMIRVQIAFDTEC